jgi:cyclophilin family peptidyl-prolyl cis-trans isomerase
VPRAVIRTLVALLFTFASAEAFAEVPIVAVFGIEDARTGGAKLGAKELENLTDYLSTKLSSSGAFKIVPNAQLRSALSEKKAETYRACFDTSCQIEIGKELAAQKTLSTKIFMVGKQCVVASTLYDLREAASERSADVEGACDSGSIGAALKEIAAKLSGGAPAVAVRAQDQPAETKNPIVEIKTSMGKIRAELFADKAPISAGNFLRYVDLKFYDDTCFHRVIKNFMIQGGGYHWFYKKKDELFPAIKNEAGNGLRNELGTLAVARTSEPDSGTSQFFINVANNKHLDATPGGTGYQAGFAVFGRVIEGMDVVNKIAATKTGLHDGLVDVPLEPVKIESIRRVP